MRVRESTHLICSPAVTGRGPEPRVRDEGDCGTLGLGAGACTMENEANAPANVKITRCELQEQARASRVLTRPVCARYTTSGFHLRY
jgi:hypothetical protein